MTNAEWRAHVASCRLCSLLMEVLNERYPIEQHAARAEEVSDHAARAAARARVGALDAERLLRGREVRPRPN